MISFDNLSLVGVQYIGLQIVTVARDYGAQFVLQSQQHQAVLKLESYLTNHGDVSTMSRGYP